MGTASTWTPGRKDTLRKLAAEGLSAAAIAVEMGDVSRGSVIGACHRYSIKLKGIPLTLRASPRPRKPPSGLRFGGNLAPRLAPPPQAKIVEPIASDLGPTMRLLGRNMHSQCAFPYGEPSANMMCCGRQIERGSYCSAHRLVTHVHSPSRHRQPERFERAVLSPSPTQKRTATGAPVKSIHGSPNSPPRPVTVGA